MIIEMFLDVIYNILSTLFVFDIPDLPPDILGYTNQFNDIISACLGMVANYVPLGYFVVLLGIVLAMDGALLIYRFVMWIIRKIPLAGIS